MNDIHDIKNILTAIEYVRRDTWYIIGVGIIVYLIFIFFLIIFERYNKMREQYAHQDNNSNVAQDPLVDLALDDVEFFEKISLAVRTHLENAYRIPLATKKTPQEIYKKVSSQNLKKILDTCVFYEYTGQEATLAQKRIIKGLAREFLMLQNVSSTK